MINSVDGLLYLGDLRVLGETIHLTTSSQSPVVFFDLILNTFDRFKVFDGLHMKFCCCVFISNDKSPRMELQRRQSPLQRTRCLVLNMKLPDNVEGRTK